MVAPSSEVSDGASASGSRSGSSLGSNTRIVMSFSSVLLFDRHGHRERFFGVPGRDDGAESAGGAAGGDDQQVVRRPQRGVYVVTLVAHDDAFADAPPVLALHTRALVDELAHVALGPAGGVEHVAMLA